MPLFANLCNVCTPAYRCAGAKACIACASDTQTWSQFCRDHCCIRRCKLFHQWLRRENRNRVPQTITHPRCYSFAIARHQCSLFASLDVFFVFRQVPCPASVRKSRIEHRALHLRLHTVGNASTAERGRAVRKNCPLCTFRNFSWITDGQCRGNERARRRRLAASVAVRWRNCRTRQVDSTQIKDGVNGAFSARARRRRNNDVLPGH